MPRFVQRHAPGVRAGKDAPRCAAGEVPRRALGQELICVPVYQPAACKQSSSTAGSLTRINQQRLKAACVGHLVHGEGESRDDDTLGSMEGV